MQQYKISVIETVLHTSIIEASGKKEAEAIAEELISNGNMFNDGERLEIESKIVEIN